MSLYKNLAVTGGFPHFLLRRNFQVLGTEVHWHAVTTWLFVLETKSSQSTIVHRNKSTVTNTHSLFTYMISVPIEILKVS